MIRLEKDEALARLAEEASRSHAFGGCTMCRLATEMDPKRVVAENRSGVVVLDDYGSTEGHLLVIAKSHVEQAAAFSWNSYQEIQQLVWQATRVLNETMKPRRIYTASLGSSEALPMTFPHYHVHVVPIYESGPGARPAHIFSWSSGVVCYEEADAASLCQALRLSWQTQTDAGGEI